MERVIVAFESERNAQKIREIIESAGVATCLICRSAAEVKRLVHKQHINTVIYGFKLPDDSCENLRGDLPASCNMLMLAVQNRLELCEQEDIFKLTAPVRKSDLLASVRMLLQMKHKSPTYEKPQRSEEELALVAEAKRVLMERHGMTEEQAHRFLQKQSMDNGAKLTDTARTVLSEA